MNPNSAYYLSFDTGYPNAYDRAHGRTGAHLMVHGTCSSAGCYAMTDEAIAEVYAIARDAFSGGQRGFQFQAYPFRMTAENLAKHRADPHMAFWKNLKEGSDYFEVMKEEPKVAVANQRYAFGSDDPTVVAAVEKKRAADEQKVADLVAKGTPAVRVVYEDGGGHASFREAMVASTGGDDGSVFAVLAARPRRNLGEVSRPDALAMGPREIVIDGGKAKPEKIEKPSTALAYAGAAPAARGDDGRAPFRARPGKGVGLEIALRPRVQLPRDKRRRGARRRRSSSRPRCLCRRGAVPRQGPASGAPTAQRRFGPPRARCRPRTDPQERDDFSSSRHPALPLCLSMIFSENR